MSSYVSPLLFRFNKINGRGYILYGELTEALAEGTSSPLGPPDFEGTYFLHSSLPSATGVGCQGPIFFAHSPSC